MPVLCTLRVRGPERRDDPFWTHMRRLRASKAPLLAVFGELDTPEAVKANVRAIRQILDQAGRRDYTVKVYPNATVNARHNLMEVPPDNPNEYVRRKRFPPGFFETIGGLDDNTASSACTSQAFLNRAPLIGCHLQTPDTGSPVTRHPEPSRDRGSSIHHLPFTIHQ